MFSITPVLIISAFRIGLLLGEVTAGAFCWKKWQLPVLCSRQYEQGRHACPI